MNPPSRGFTLVEVLIAILILAVGIIALAGSSASVTRMIGRGKIETRAAHAATRRMEQLRLAAAVRAEGGLRCSSPAFASGGPVIGAGMSERWQVLGSGRVRQVRVSVSYLTVRGPRTAELETRITC